jgi:hypothetical protein
MTYFELKWGHNILAPRHKTFVLEKTITTPSKPNLLTESCWDFNFYHPIIYLNKILNSVDQVSFSIGEKITLLFS